MKSFDDNPSSNYKDVLSAGSVNYQMFAYCPTLSHKTCGLGNDNSNYDMTVYAGKEKKDVSSNKMRYIRGVTQNEREYDACYYMVKAEEGTDPDG